jgi:hypothetical protein
VVYCTSGGATREQRRRRSVPNQDEDHHHETVSYSDRRRVVPALGAMSAQAGCINLAQKPGAIIKLPQMFLQAAAPRNQRRLWRIAVCEFRHNT